MARGVSIDDLSPLGPPISNDAGRTWILGTVTVFVYVTSSTSRPLVLRLLVIALLGSNVYLLLTMPDLMGHFPGFDALIANFIVAWLLRAIDLYFLRDESKMVAGKLNSKSNGAIDGQTNGTAESTRKTRSSKEVETYKDKPVPHFIPMTPFQALDYLVLNHRLIGTPYQARSVRPFSASNPAWVPSRTNFLLRKTLHLAAAYLTLDALCNLQSPPPLWSFSREQEHFFSRLNEVTPAELWYRWLCSLNLWASCTCLIEYIYAAIALVCVGSGICEPRDFPPLVGQIKDWTSVRNHWGKFWHQVFQAPYVANATALAESLLRPFPKSKSARRYLTNFLVFAISGVCHTVQPIGVTRGWPQVRQSLFFFPAQFCAVAFEDWFQAWWNGVRGRDGKKDEEWAWWEKAVGFVWTQAWLAWSCSIWVYPTLRRGGEGMMPFSFVNMIRGHYLKEKIE